LLKISYRNITIVGFVLLIIGFILLALFQRETARNWLYFDLALVGAGLGLTMLTLLIAVQQAVERNQLGIATSLNQFSRSIGGAFGVAIMGTVLTAGLAFQLQSFAQKNTEILTVEKATELAENPNALIEPKAKAELPAEVLNILQESMAKSIHTVFWVGAVISFLALLVALWLPKKSDKEPEKDFELNETAMES
jgi:MFS family permease